MTNTGTVVEGTSAKGVFDPQMSAINCAVPSKSALDSVQNPVCKGTSTGSYTYYDGQSRYIVSLDHIYDI
jgi:hypothetical protein